jgi:lipopolysaccharide export system permease protein|tara:strand:+ start:226192 stop:227352 length:1161 start_codon:yes stop_codon:yes gene_type:complete
MNRYLFWQLLGITIVVSLTLTGVIFLSQSLRFLELIIESGASSSIFIMLILLALPRFFEVIIPVALSVAVLFLYNRMTADSELVVMRSLGFSPGRIARPAIFLSLLISILLMVMTTWAGPSALAKMQRLRKDVTAEYSSLIFREGVFNSVARGVTIYIRERNDDGSMSGLLIHDARDKGEPASTIAAKSGIIVSTPTGQQVLVYDGVRQSFNPSSGALNRLKFNRYTIEIPNDKGSVNDRWVEPDERTFLQLLNPDLSDLDDLRHKREFMVEAHRRIISPLLAPCFALISLCALLLGPVSRRGQGKRIISAAASVIILQSLYLVFFNIAKDHNFGIVLLYIITLLPLVFCGYIISEHGESLRAKLLRYGFTAPNQPKTQDRGGATI